MPEMPEVETVVRLLRPRLVGRTVTRVEVRWLRTLGGGSVAAFRRGLCGRRIVRVWRRAKYAVFDLQHDGQAAGFLVGHLRMTGRFHVEPPAWDPGPHVRVSLDLDDGRRWHFIDVRKFGRLWLRRRLEPLLSRLGPEPLEGGFSAAWLAGALRARRRQLKPLLLDQEFLAGLGNIYVDEALHRAGLHPLTLSTQVAPQAATRLHAAVQEVLQRAIAREGSSFDAFYRTPEGRPGGFQEEFAVYGRAGRPCLRCGATIVRLVVGQRGTHLCPRCQARRARRVARTRAR